MSEQVRRWASTERPLGGKVIHVVAATDYDALHAEAEANAKSATYYMDAFADAKAEAEATKIESQILRNTEEHHRGQIAEMGREIRQLKAEAEALRAELFATKQKLSVAQRFSPRIIGCNCGEYVPEGYLCACERGIL